MRYWALVLCLLVGPLMGEEPSTLRVTGSSRLLQAADMLVLQVGVVTRHADAQKAVRDNAEKMQLVVAALKKAGLTEKEFQTGRFSVVPQYSVPPKNPDPNWQATIVGYEVHNSLKIQSAQMELAGALIDSVVKEGSNTIDEVSFTLRDTEQAQARAIGEAVRQARVYADSAAQAANVSLKGVLEMEVNPSFNPVRPMRMEKFAAGGFNDASTALSPGDVEVTASVTIVYQLKD